MNNNSDNKNDFRQDLTAEIISMIETNTAPWQKPWDASMGNALLDLPHNAITGRQYRGANSLYLMVKAQKMGFGDDPRWCTFRQANDNGWKIKKGSKGTQIEYWKFEKTVERINEETGEVVKVQERTESPSVFYAKVFHASQIEGIPEYSREAGYDWNPVEKAESILVESGAKIYHDQADRAYYTPTLDQIHLPAREAFESEEKYYATALHELGHWTGHTNRLNRDLTGNFGSESYAKEELRAEMASLFLAAGTGVPFNPGQHAAYQKSWIKALKNDKNEIFRAAKDAEKIADYVMGLALEKNLENKISGEKEKVDTALSLSSEETKAIEKRIKEINKLPPKANPKRKSLSPVKEYQHQVKAFGEALFDKFERENIDQVVAENMLKQGYTKPNVERALREASPLTITRAASYPKELVAQLAQKPEVKKAIKQIGIER